MKKSCYKQGFLYVNKNKMLSNSYINMIIKKEIYRQN